MTECHSCTKFVVDNDSGHDDPKDSADSLFTLAQQRESRAMQIICCNAAALCIAVLYYTWRDTTAERHRRKKVLRERVAYMLWVASNSAA